MIKAILKAILLLLMMEVALSAKMYDKYQKPYDLCSLIKNNNIDISIKTCLKYEKELELFEPIDNKFSNMKDGKEKREFFPIYVKEFRMIDSSSEDTMRSLNHSISSYILGNFKSDNQKILSSIDILFSSNYYQVPDHVMKKIINDNGGNLDLSPAGLDKVSAYLEQEKYKELQLKQKQEQEQVQKKKEQVQAQKKKSKFQDKYLKIAQQECNRGYVEGCMEIARIHQDDDPQYSENMYTYLCNKKVVKACTEGAMFIWKFPKKINFQDEKMIRKIEKVESLYSTACDYGNECGHLRSWYMLMCDKGDANACYTLGNIFEKGIRVRSSLFDARAYYHYACILGIKEGCNKVDKLNEFFK